MPTTITDENWADPKVFDRKTILKRIDAGENPVELLKVALDQGHEYLRKAFNRRRPPRELVSKLCWLSDQVVTLLWQLKVSSPNLALVAVGGYGRGDLCPGSDIDLMILYKRSLTKKDKAEIESFLTALWDVGMEVGHSVRTVNECVDQARVDITVATNLMESRMLIGDQNLYDSMRKATGPGKIWSTRKFFKAKLQEQTARHEKYNNIENSLEPNVKEGPGGLRDIQMIGWVAKRHFGVARLSELVSHGFLTGEEYRILDEGRSFLWKVRTALHHITGRREDRLLFEHQRQLARSFGYRGHGNDPVEKFMRTYYRTVVELSRLNEVLLQHFQEVIIYYRWLEKTRTINKRFQTRNNFIEVKNKAIFSRYPFALLEIFLLIQQNPKIQGVRASTIRLIRQNLDRIDDDFRKDLRNRSLFMEIIRQERWVGQELRRMHRYGVLGAYLPIFARVEGLMQFDLFHAYTVDEHTLLVVRYMRLFGLPEYKERFSQCYRLIQAIPKREILYIAGLFHDIAKGRGGDHSELGAIDAYRFCRQHAMSEYDANLVAWLVKNHLLMSRTAQQMDIDDINIINQFARTVGNARRLDYLYLLTVADINGTNPGLWNSWKDALLINLYDKTLRALRRGLESPLNNQERVLDIKSTALRELEDRDISSDSIHSVWQHLNDEFFLRHSPDEITWYTQKISQLKNRDAPMIQLREKTERGGSEIFIYMKNRDNIFATTTRVLSKLRLNILDARIITSANDYTHDSYIVLEKNGKPIYGTDRKNDIIRALGKALSNIDSYVPTQEKINVGKLRYFPVETRVWFSENREHNHTVMEVTCMDHPGILNRIGEALRDCNARIHGAKVATFGERVDDLFFITDRQNNMITDQSVLDCIEKNITSKLDPARDVAEHDLATANRV